MKFLGLAIATLCAAFAFAAPPAAFAAPAKAAAAAPYSKDQITKGTAQAPAVIQAAGLPCTIADAAFISEGTTKNPDDPKGKEVKVSSYEVACREGMGYILQNYVGIPLKFYDCISLSESPSPCRLPENLDVRKMMSSIVTAAGKTCTVNNQRALGATKTGDRFYEVGCSEGLGFLIKAPSPMSKEAPVAEDCARQVGTSLECKFTTKEQIAAVMTAKMNALVATSGKPCQVTNSREVGADTAGNAYYEVACSSGTGYMFAEKDGKYVRALDCANAKELGGGCTLSDSSKAESAENGTYTRLSNASGYPCTVVKYRYIGIDPKTNSEVVELQCSNRPDGAVALFPTDNSHARFYDCVAAAALGQSCKLSEASASYSKYTQALAAKGKTTCKVSGAKWLGATAAGQNFIETACSDGLPGWVIAQTPTGSVAELLTCGQAKSSGVACSLPGNTK